MGAPITSEHRPRREFYPKRRSDGAQASSENSNQSRCARCLRGLSRRPEVSVHTETCPGNTSVCTVHGARERLTAWPGRRIDERYNALALTAREQFSRARGCADLAQSVIDGVGRERCARRGNDSWCGGGMAVAHRPGHREPWPCPRARRWLKARRVVRVARASTAIFMRLAS